MLGDIYMGERCEKGRGLDGLRVFAVLVTKYDRATWDRAFRTNKIATIRGENFIGIASFSYIYLYICDLN